MCAQWKVRSQKLNLLAINNPFKSWCTVFLCVVLIRIKLVWVRIYNKCRLLACWVTQNLYLHCIYNLEIKQVISEEKHLTLIMVRQKSGMMPDTDVVSVHWIRRYSQGWVRNRVARPVRQNQPQTSPTLSKNPVTQHQNSEYAHT